VSKSTDWEELIKWGAIAIGAYLLYKALTKASDAAGAALNTAQQGTSDILTRLFDPNANAANAASEFAVAVFPDGSSHAIDISTVSATGQFVWKDGQSYTLYRGVGGNAAVPASTVIDSTVIDSITAGAAAGG
jgi:hypothetical protein